MDDMSGASPNYDEICGVLEQRLEPVFELVGSRLQELEDTLAQQKDILYKMVTGFGDAVNEHKKGSYSEMLASKYGPDLDEIGGPYSDLYGKDIKAELLEKLMGGEMGEDAIPGFVGGIKEKFAKIRGPAIDGSMKPPEPVAEEVKAEEKPPEAEEEPEPTDGAGKIAKGLGLKLSSPKVPNFNKK